MLKCDAKSTGLFPKGGSRNRADRVSWQLTERQCRTLIDAAWHAEELGQPFNRFITLLWERGGIDSKDNAKVTGRFIKLAGDWSRQRGYLLNWAWVQEWGSFNRSHVHILMHVPQVLDPVFRPMPLRWTKRLLPADYVGGVLQSQKLTALSNVNARRADVLGKVHYMLKCSPSDLESKLDMTGRGYIGWGRSCMVIGKRLARWQQRAVT